jgi:hypothetical protein
MKFKMMEEIEILKEEIKNMLNNANEKTIKMTHAMLEASTEDDWWNELSDEEKNEIDEAIKESEKEENYIPLETFQSEFNTWRKELLSSKEQNKK